MIGVSRKLPEFKYDPAVCSFKTWLLNQTMWRIKDQFRKRPKGGGVSSQSGPREAARLDDTRRTGTIERIGDPQSNELEVLWEADWQQTVARTAMQRVKEQANLKDCQIFDLYVLRQWPAREVARALGVSVARVYLAKHRIAPLMKKEIKRLETTLL